MKILEKNATTTDIKKLCKERILRVHQNANSIMHTYQLLNVLTFNLKKLCQSICSCTAYLVAP